ncbi:hypothetical protein OH77DRAFT_1420672 [Trametes cingulata]|nr:hypothetical protein OH77DRAFT_1420672 [Trametes cingulata]
MSSAHSSSRNDMSLPSDSFAMAPLWGHMPVRPEAVSDESNPSVRSVLTTPPSVRGVRSVVVAGSGSCISTASDAFPGQRTHPSQGGIATQSEAASLGMSTILLFLQVLTIRLRMIWCRSMLLFMMLLMPLMMLLMMLL